MQVVIRVKGKQCMVQQAAGCQGLPPRRCLYSSVPCTYPVQSMTASAALHNLRMLAIACIHHELLLC